MAGVDSLLRMLAEHGADELRLATDEAPRMSKRGSPVRLSIPPTGVEIMRHLLEPLLPPEREAELRDSGRLEATYRPESGGAAFAVTLVSRGGKLEATFRAGAATTTGAAGKAAPVAPAVPPPRFGAHAPPGIAGVTTPASSSPVLARPAALASVEPASVPAPVASSVVTAAVTSGSAAPANRGAGVGAALTALLRRATQLGASDVHLMTGELPSLRVDGKLRSLHDEPPVVVEELLAGAVPDEAWPRAFAGRSADGAFELPGLGRFRVNVYRAAERLAAALRVLPRQAPSLAELNLPAMTTLEDLVAAPHGLILVSGATGSGKSATLAALAQAALQRRGGLLVSLEDPVEYAIVAERGSLVRQRQIGTDVVDFATGLRDALREDPDVLLIGEMRDTETIGLALTAAETGHLVLASLHSRSAASSVERIVDSYVGARQQQIRVQLADSLRAVVSQRLLPRAHGAGRLPAIELMRVNHNVASLIREGKTAQILTAIQSSKKDGMLPLERCLADMVRADQIERHQAVAAANDPASLALYLQG